MDQLARAWRWVARTFSNALGRPYFFVSIGCVKDGEIIMTIDYNAKFIKHLDEKLGYNTIEGYDAKVNAFIKTVVMSMDESQDIDGNEDDDDDFPPEI